MKKKEQIKRLTTEVRVLRDAINKWQYIHKAMLDGINDSTRELDRHIQATVNEIEEIKVEKECRGYSHTYTDANGQAVTVPDNNVFDRNGQYYYITRSGVVEKVYLYDQPLAKAEDKN